MLDVPGDGPFIQKPILKNRYKFDHVARRSTVWRYVAACWVSRVRTGGVGWRSANRVALSALNGNAPANRTLSTPRDRLQGIGLRQFALGNGSIGRVNDAKVWVTYMHTQRRSGWVVRAWKTLRRLYALNANLFRRKKRKKVPRFFFLNRLSRKLFVRGIEILIFLFSFFRLHIIGMKIRWTLFRV